MRLLHLIRLLHLCSSGRRCLCPDLGSQCTVFTLPLVMRFASAGAAAGARQCERRQAMTDAITCSPRPQTA